MKSAAKIEWRELMGTEARRALLLRLLEDDSLRIWYCEGPHEGEATMRWMYGWIEGGAADFLRKIESELVFTRSSEPSHLPQGDLKTCD